MIMTGLTRLGGDALVRFRSNGDAVCNLSLAFNYGRKGEDNRRPSQWVDASLWGKRAEALAPYLLKGGLVDVVLGEPHIEEYQGKNGAGYKLVARVMEIELAGGSIKENHSTQERSDSDPTRHAAQHQVGGGTKAYMDDDIPF